MTSIDFNKYQSDAASTMNPNLDVRDKIANCGTGLAGEVLEISQAIWPKEQNYLRLLLPFPKDTISELAKELGDICWYSAVLAKSYGEFSGDETTWKMSSICADIVNKFKHNKAFASAGLERSFFSLADHVEEVHTLVKWHIYHYHKWTADVSEKIRNALHFVIEDVANLAELGCDMRLQEVLDANIEKLRRRYPTGQFTTEHSVNRSS